MFNYGNMDVGMSTINLSTGDIAGLTLLSVALYLFQSIALYKYAVAVGLKDKAYKMWIPVAKDQQILKMGGLSVMWLLLIIGAIIPVMAVSLMFATIYYIVYNVAIYKMVKKYNGENYAMPAVLLSVLTASVGFLAYVLLVLIEKKNIKAKHKK